MAHSGIVNGFESFVRENFPNLTLEQVLELKDYGTYFEFGICLLADLRATSVLLLTPFFCFTSALCSR
tara:strand:- start:62 stop:265 length:204 start_codon:yes stop_codon:yes gene_type:complete